MYLRAQMTLLVFRFGRFNKQISATMSSTKTHVQIYKNKFLRWSEAACGNTSNIVSCDGNFCCCLKKLKSIYLHVMNA